MGMSFCLTVQGEQPIKAATWRMSRGGPNAGGKGPEDAPGCATGGPGCLGQCPGRHWPKQGAEKGLKCRGLRVLGSRAFGEEAGAFGYFGLVIMVVGVGSFE
jgi:hypothetical protein